MIGRIGYLCSVYPAVSHTFVYREVEALRRLGAPIETFTIHRTEQDELLSAADREAARTTFAILPPSWRRLLGSHLRGLLRHPVAYLSTLMLALRLSPASFRGPLWQSFYFGEAVVLWDECRRREIRHLHVHFANVAADVALLASHLGSEAEPARPWSWSFTMHGPVELFDVRHFRLAQKLRRAEFVICISDYAKSQMMALSPPADWRKLRVVHVGLPVAEFSPADPPPSNGGAPVPEVLCLGRLVPEKGQAVLLEAAALLAARGRRVELTIAGAGPSRGELEELALRLGIAGRVSFLGAIGQDELRQRYAAATAFCLPSFAEGVPVVLMEAMAMGVAVVSTRITGIPELIEDGEGGLLVAPGRADELAAALERLLGDERLRRRLAANGRRKVLDEFDIEVSARALYAAFAALPTLSAPSASVPARANVGV